MLVLSRRLYCLGTFVILLMPLSAFADGGQVNVYSYRPPFLITPLFNRFTNQTGIEVKLIFAKKGLVERVASEGTHSRADIILTTDIGKLVQAAQTIAQRVESPILKQHIPKAARDDNLRWFGLTWRARIGYASKARVKEKHITYADLATKIWRGRICLRSGQHPYNNALFAAMLAHLGEPEFRTWLAGMKANLAQRPSGNDRAQVRKVYAGDCDLAIGNTYYMGKMQTNDKRPEQKAWAAAVNPIFLTMPKGGGGEKNGGAHVNLSGMVMAKHAPNRANAQRLMEFLISAQAQKIYAETNFEYPVRTGIAMSPRIASWGRLIRDALPMEIIAANRIRASRIVDEIDFNTGP